MRNTLRRRIELLLAKKHLSDVDKEELILHFLDIMRALADMEKLNREYEYHIREIKSPEYQMRVQTLTEQLSAKDAELELLKEMNKRLEMSSRHCPSCGRLAPDHDPRCGRLAMIIEDQEKAIFVKDTEISSLMRENKRLNDAIGIVSMSEQRRLVIQLRGRIDDLQSELAAKDAEIAALKSAKDRVMR